MPQVEDRSLNLFTTAVQRVTMTVPSFLWKEKDELLLLSKSILLGFSITQKSIWGIAESWPNTLFIHYSILLYSYTDIVSFINLNWIDYGW